MLKAIGRTTWIVRTRQKKVLMQHMLASPETLQDIQTILTPMVGWVLIETLLGKERSLLLTLEKLAQERIEEEDEQEKWQFVIQTAWRFELEGKVFVGSGDTIDTIKTKLKTLTAYSFLSIIITLPPLNTPPSPSIPLTPNLF